uniref:Rubredoxin-like domain-containing protein n=1 Tax=Eucampia antarctica TaxID=49252 RepID=A0A7S2WQG7_9STRA|mmetsp:Transcript_8382/g.7935  ORF Transcript_8382/g.7935 Transcript_8382/m.7935 type:complete len:495 (+) Transcript_8382:57-1541(+)|eukprot:CAMPEP_0197831658 /NCGR_PEP_ID=MMETSP1437-20131217/11422_1 /TAXON_ID=49252 ORGANISM="Eucampia antarctica, Strain CCMP1452" /NCGR_SAMPLE_ID=MMETSP1437 /ASSEMBLY_ACC=CAM_ASM_001096 /LENGTH=494 /DNA_ID=CAMNT_0043434671 /DNA_START=53 /DNA_END=1537 /DNA_ORIENTATION=-
MKVSTGALKILFLGSITVSHVVDSFVVPLPFGASTKATQCSMASSGEFDYLLNEGSGSLQYQQQKQQNSNGRINRRNIIRLPDSSEATTLVSATLEAPELSLGLGSSADPFGDDSLGDATYNDDGSVAAPSQKMNDPRLEEYLRKKEASAAIKIQPTEKKSLPQMAGNYVKGKDFGELFFTVFIPLTAGYWVIKQGYEKSSVIFAGSAEQTLVDYADEMVFHDGDFEEMKMCHNDYSKKKLVWLGPNKKDTMMKRYLEIYAKKKTVSPQAISSLSYVFSLYKLSEDKAADILVALCNSMPEKISSAGKLLFFGRCILKSKEGRARLEPIKEMLALSYRDGGSISGEEIVERSQIAMGEAAYRTAVAAAGKKQESLTVGWEVLGLDEETATTIFNEVAKIGFKTGREVKYGSGNQQYDSKGRRLEKTGKLENPEEATDDDDKEDDDDENTPTGSVFECGGCGYTLFIAKGRDFKFFSDTFECPECGAKKDKFVGL